MHGSSLAVLKGTLCLLTSLIFFNSTLILFLFPGGLFLYVCCFHSFLLSHHCAVLGWCFVPHFLSCFLPTSLSTELQRAIMFYVCNSCFLFINCFPSRPLPSSSVQTRRCAAKPRWLLAGCIVSASVAAPPVFTFSGFGFGSASRSAKPQVAKAPPPLFFSFRTRLETFRGVSCPYFYRL